MSNKSYISGAGKPKKNIGIIVGAGVAVLAVASIALYNLVPPIKNTVRMSIMKPENYYATIEKEYMSDTAKSISDSYALSIENANRESIGVDMEVSVDFGTKLKEYLVDYGLDELNNITIKDSIDYKDNKIGQAFDISANDVSFMTANLITDIEASMLYAQVPMLSEDYIKQDMSENSMTSLDSYYGILSESMGFNYEAIMKGDILSSADIEKTIVKYSDIVYNNVSSVEINKNVEGTVAGLNYKYNVVEAKFDEDAVVKIATEIIETAKEDEVVKNFCIDAEICTADEYDEMLKEALEDIENNLGGEKASEFLIMKLYVDATGVIRGRDFDFHNDEDTIADDLDFNYILVKEGKAYAIEFNSTADDTGMRLEVNANENNKKYTGTANIYLTNYGQEEKIGISFADAQIIQSKDGNSYINGKFTADLKIDGEKMEFEVICETDGNSQSISYTYEDYGTINIKLSTRDAKDVEIPTGKMYDMSDQDDIAEYTSNIDFDTIIPDILKKVGLNKTLEIYEQYINAYSLYSDYGDYDYDDYADYFGDYDYGDYGDYFDDYDYGGYGDYFDDYDYGDYGDYFGDYDYENDGLGDYLTY